MAGDWPKPITHSPPTRERGWHEFAKASGDYLCASFALIVFLPSMLVISALIVLDSRGPVFVRQRCRGANGKSIAVWKFRTAAVPEHGEGIMLPCPAEERVTSVGRVLRETRLDALPMLLNVLAGDMSLAGPPPLSAHNAPLRQAKPGIVWWRSL